MRVLCLNSIILPLLATSGYLFFEEKCLETRLSEITRETVILEAEVPDPIIKYATLMVDTDDPQIKELAISLGGPSEIYLFVRDDIEYSETYDKERTALEVLENRKGDCLGKADLLAALLLSYGYSRDEVKVSMGYVTHEGQRRHHAWLEFNNEGKWIVLDSSTFLGTCSENGISDPFIKHLMQCLM